MLKRASNGGLEDFERRLRQLAEPESLARIAADHYSRFVCPEHGSSPEVTAQGRNPNGTIAGEVSFCCEQLRDIFKAAREGADEAPGTDGVSDG